MTIQVRTVESIVVGHRHRTELGDLTPLIESISRLGLLQPITITPDGILICGRRRLEAIKRLGWRTVKVWIRSGISTRLETLIAERDENVTHQPLSQVEQAALYAEVRELMREDAARRQEASRFGSGESPEPALTLVGSRHEQESRARAARLVTGRDSHQRLERILEMERIAFDKARSKTVREYADTELAKIRNGEPVSVGWERVQALVRAESEKAAWLATTPEEVDQTFDKALKDAQVDRRRRINENRERRVAQARKARRSPRAFALMWAELSGWTRKYDASDIAASVKPDDWKLFVDTVAESQAFLDDVERLRAEKPVPEAS